MHGQIPRLLTLLLPAALWLAGPVAAAAPQVELPTWPQTFTLYAGGTVEFGFAATQPGAVAVDLQWQGVPLTVGLKDVAQSRLGAPAAHSAPRASISYDLTAANVTRSCVWVVTLAAPKPPGGPAKALPATAPKPVATGRISISAPQADMGVLQQRLPAIIAAQDKAAEAAKAKRPPRQTPPGIDARLAAVDKEAQAKLAADRDRVGREVEALSRQSRAQTGRPAGPKGEAGLRDAKWSAALDKVRRQPGAGGPSRQPPPGKPVLNSVRPSAGSPGDEVLLKATGVAGPPEGVTVLFTLRAGANAAGKMVAYAPADDDGPDSITVAVPYPGPNAPDYSGQVRIRDGAGRDSNWVPFRYTAPALPTITSAAPGGPCCHPGDQLTVQGTDFLPGSQVYFQAAYTWNAPVPADVWPGTSPNSTSISVAIPDYTSNCSFEAWVYVAYPYTSPYVSATIAGEWYRVRLDASEPSLTRAKPASGQLGTAVTLSGQGFGSAQGEVHFRVPPAGNDVAAEVLCWGDTAIAVTVPDASGFAKPSQGQVYVKLVDGRTCESLPFQFEPITEHRLLRLKPSLLASDYVFQPQSGDDEWGFDPDDTSITATHYGSFWGSRNGVDLWYLKFKLLNGWTVEQIEFNADDVNMGGGRYRILSLLGDADLLAGLPGTPSPYVAVQWWTPGGSFVTCWGGYQFRVLLKGPKGVPAGD